MTPLEIFGLQFVMSVLVVSLIAKFYVAPWLAQKSTNDALMILLVPHMFRHIGMSFLVPGLVGPSLAGSFAGAAAYGDLISAFAAVLALVGMIGSVFDSFRIARAIRRPAPGIKQIFPEVGDAQESEPGAGEGAERGAGR